MVIPTQLTPTESSSPPEATCYQKIDCLEESFSLSWNQRSPLIIDSEPVALKEIFKIFKPLSLFYEWGIGDWEREGEALFFMVMPRAATWNSLFPCHVAISVASSSSKAPHSLTCLIPPPTPPWMVCSLPFWSLTFANASWWCPEVNPILAVAWPQQSQTRLSVIRVQDNVLPWNPERPRIWLDKTNRSLI